MTVGGTSLRKTVRVPVSGGAMTLMRHLSLGVTFLVLVFGISHLRLKTL
jgi:hypothetical protein